MLFVAIVLSICVPCDAASTIEQALRNGCYTGAQTRALLDKALPQINGTLTRQRLDYNFPDGSGFADNVITKDYVTSAETWVFRGYDGPDTSPHIMALKQGSLISKSKMQLDKRIAKGGQPEEQIIKEFWDQNGPNVATLDDSGRNPITILLRLLAIKSSDVPASQYISVAVDFATAASFGNPVYAFQVNPHSPLLGLVGCRLEGEFQLQIPNGTAIANLHRRFRNGPWEKYNPSLGQWAPVDHGPPSD
jgi:hypothetical protein